MKNKFFTKKVQKELICSECGTKVFDKDCNLKHSVCKWCAFKHTKTFKQREKAKAFSEFIDNIKGGNKNEM